LFEQLLQAVVVSSNSANNKVPVAVVDKVEVPSFTTFTTGAVGVVLERQRLNL
jgi:hypothetical protein